MTLAAALAGASTVAVVGLSKNAGKTTVVNHLLENLAPPLAVASLGLDGEVRDALTGFLKPRVRPPAGTLVLTTSMLADGAEGDFPVIAELSSSTAAGRVVVCRARGASTPGGDRPAIQVSGPTTLHELDESLEWLRRAGASTIVLEGALGRVGPAAAGRADAVVLACGAATAPDHRRLTAALRIALERLRLDGAGEDEAALVAQAEAIGRPVLRVGGATTAAEVPLATGYESELVAAVRASGADVLALPGALTEPLAAALAVRPPPALTVVVPDATHVLAEPATSARLRRSVRVCAARSLALRALASNPFRPEGEDETASDAFAAVCDAAPDLPVFDVVAGLSRLP